MWQERASERINVIDELQCHFWFHVESSSSLGTKFPSLYSFSCLHDPARARAQAHELIILDDEKKETFETCLLWKLDSTRASNLLIAASTNRATLKERISLPSLCSSIAVFLV